MRHHVRGCQAQVAQAVAIQEATVPVLMRNPQPDTNLCPTTVAPRHSALGWRRKRRLRGVTLPIELPPQASMVAQAVAEGEAMKALS